MCFPIQAYCEVDDGSCLIAAGSSEGGKGTTIKVWKRLPTPSTTIAETVEPRASTVSGGDVPASAAGQPTSQTEADGDSDRVLDSRGAAEHLVLVSHSLFKDLGSYFQLFVCGAKRFLPRRIQGKGYIAIAFCLLVTAICVGRWPGEADNVVVKFLEILGGHVAAVAVKASVKLANFAIDMLKWYICYVNGCVPGTADGVMDREGWWDEWDVALAGAENNLSSPTATMSSPPFILAHDGLAAMNAEREKLEALHLQLEHDVRCLLQPAGFGHVTTEWEGLAHSVFTFANREYRHEAKIDIQEGARKIRRMHGVDKLVPRIVEQARNYQDILALVGEFKALLQRHEQNLPRIDAAAFKGCLRTFEEGAATFKRHLDAACTGMRTYKGQFRILDRPGAIVLNDAVSQRQNILAARPMLARLAELSQERLKKVDRASVIFAQLSRRLVENVAIPESIFDEYFQAYKAITGELEQQKPLQGYELGRLTDLLCGTSKKPYELPGAEPGSSFSITELRRAHLHFATIVEAVNTMTEILGPFRHSLVRNIERLQLRSRIIIVRVN
ncbi:hypothetical protein GSI_05488 [Ganoderma sinense ZZ0214-1]|uniref:Uncharacterized protein n=1 Tax=Ganoderma sinense ZZ0214-1 TaxID=1077348 RepID=A0A2G8SER7_9APHY|nr:hypothetical protein GSI_05488 [Ganoderma sinense ZZ0214-1]